MRIWGMARCDMCGENGDDIEHVKIAEEAFGYSVGFRFLEADLCKSCLAKVNEAVGSAIDRLAHELGGKGKTR